jgi:type IV pilus assembly protein PilM
MCLRYYSVTFRGQTMDRMVVCGGEATESLAEGLGQRLDLPAELGDPLRAFAPASDLGRDGGWDVAAGLAMRTIG